MDVSDEAFLFEAGDHVLYQFSSGRFLGVVVIERIYSSECPEYLIRSICKPHDPGVECPQKWLRSIKLSPEELKAYMLAHSPPGQYGVFAVRARRL